MTQIRAGKVHYIATNPDRIFDKCRECRFFLVQLAEHELEMDIEKFLYCLSAFLSAFRTAIYRSLGVVRTLHGKPVSETFRESLYKNADIKFLKETTDLEVHGDGARVWQNYRVSLIHPVPHRWQTERNGRWESPLNRDRFKSTMARGFGDGGFLREPAGWRFDGHPKNLIECCHDTLEAFEAAVRARLNLVP